MSADDDEWSSSVGERMRIFNRDEEATASAIYGVIVSAAVMSASQADQAYKMIIAVLVTLTIYWGAERYARVVAERIHEGHRPSWTSLRYQLTHGWELVSASALPLITLAVMSVLGAELSTAVLRGADLQHAAALRGGLGDRAGRPVVDGGAGRVDPGRGDVRALLRPAQDLPALSREAAAGISGEFVARVGDTGDSWATSTSTP